MGLQQTGLHCWFFIIETKIFQYCSSAILGTPFHNMLKSKGRELMYKWLDGGKSFVFFRTIFWDFIEGLLLLQVNLISSWNHTFLTAYWFIHLTSLKWLNWTSQHEKRFTEKYKNKIKIWHIDVLFKVLDNHNLSRNYQFKQLNQSNQSNQ